MASLLTGTPFPAILRVQTPVLHRQDLNTQPRRTAQHVRKSPHSRETPPHTPRARRRQDLCWGKRIGTGSETRSVDSCNHPCPETRLTNTASTMFLEGKNTGGSWAGEHDCQQAKHPRPSLRSRAAGLPYCAKWSSSMCIREGPPPT